jgi:transcription antitermination factor NusA-like protein
MAAALGGASASLAVPADRVGVVIGPKGATRRAIELEHAVDVTIATGIAPGADGSVAVRGDTQAQVDAAIAMVRGYVKQDAPGAGAGARPAATTVVPDLARGAIIGKGGASIRVLQAVTGCRIQVGDPDPASSTTAITVEGPDADMVARAVVRLQTVVAAERLRIEIKNRSLNAGAAVSPHVHRIVPVPPAANVGAGEERARHSCPERLAKAIPRTDLCASAPLRPLQPKLPPPPPPPPPPPLPPPLLPPLLLLPPPPTVCLPARNCCFCAVPCALCLTIFAPLASSPDGSVRPRVGLPQPSAAAGGLLHPHDVSVVHENLRLHGATIVVAH